MRPARPDATTSGSGSVEADGHQADETLEAIEQTGGGSLQHALVHRLRAYALMQKRDLDAAAEAVRQSLDVARRADETYELALTLEAGARWPRCAGTTPRPKRRRRKGCWHGSASSRRPKSRCSRG